jgi:hypothetical protein
VDFLGIIRHWNDRGRSIDRIDWINDRINRLMCAEILHPTPPHTLVTHSGVEGSQRPVAAGSAAGKRRPHGLIGANGGGGNNNYTRSSPKRTEPSPPLPQAQGKLASMALFSPPRKGGRDADAPFTPPSEGTAPASASPLSSPIRSVGVSLGIASPASPLSTGGAGGGGGPITLYNFPQLTEREKEHWKASSGK